MKVAKNWDLGKVRVSKRLLSFHSIIKNLSFHFSPTVVVVETFIVAELEKTLRN